MGSGEVNVVNGSRGLQGSGPVKPGRTQQRASPFVMKTTATLDLTMDGRVECLPQRSYPVDDRRLQPFCIVSASPIHTFLNLREIAEC